VHAFWARLRPDDLYLKSYSGLYCPGCEDFYLERDLVNGLCPDHERPPVPVEERNWFFRLSRYQAAVEELVASGRLRVLPEARRNEVLGLCAAGPPGYQRLAPRVPLGWVGDPRARRRHPDHLCLDRCR